MATYNKFEQFVEDLAKKVHNLSSDQLVVALTNASNAPSASADAVLGDVTQISYTNLSSRNITTSSCEQTSGTLKLILADLTLTASGGSVGPFRYVIVYNDTPTSPADPLLGWYDYGSEITLANGEELLIDFDGTNGLFSLV
jgi:hypothetical protein